LDPPTTAGAFDDIRWYLMHRDVTVFVDDGQWFLQVDRPCKHILPDNRCGAYENRPRVCRKYKTQDCDYHQGDYGYDQYFTTAEALEEYASKYLRKKYREKSNGKDTGRGKSGRATK